jgi:hypothetical protein
MGYVDGANLYQADESNPVCNVDPQGLDIDNFADALYHYIHGHGSNATFSDDVVKSITNLSEFQDSLTQYRAIVKGTVLKSYKCGDAATTIVVPGDNYVPLDVSSLNPSFLFLLGNNVTYSWVAICKVSSSTSIGPDGSDCCTINASCQINFTFSKYWTLKGLKNTIFNAIWGTPFTIYGSFTDNYSFSVKNCGCSGSEPDSDEDDSD